MKLQIFSLILSFGCMLMFIVDQPTLFDRVTLALAVIAASVIGVGLSLWTSGETLDDLKEMVNGR